MSSNLFLWSIVILFYEVKMSSGKFHRFFRIYIWKHWKWCLLLNTHIRQILTSFNECTSDSNLRSVYFQFRITHQIVITICTHSQTLSCDLHNTHRNLVFFTITYFYTFHPKKQYKFLKWERPKKMPLKERSPKDVQKICDAN